MSQYKWKKDTSKHAFKPEYKVNTFSTDYLTPCSRHKNTFWFRRHNFETIYGSSITVGEAVKSINFYMYHSSDKVVDVLKLGKMYIIKLQKVVFIVVFAILAKL